MKSQTKSNLKKKKKKKFSELNNFRSHSMSVSDKVSVRQSQDVVNVRVI